MSEASAGGDLVVAARPLTPEAFAPHGELLHPGGRVRLGKRGTVVVALDAREASPRRVRHLLRYPEASRLLVSLGAAELLLVVAGRGDRPGGPPAAFRVPPRVGVRIDAGVWHAGPVAAADATVLEAIEAVGPADRLDRTSVAEAFGAEGIRLVLPEEPDAPVAGFDPGDDASVSIASEVARRTRVAAVALRGLDATESGDDLRKEGERLAADLRRHWGRDLADVDAPALDRVRTTFRALGLDPDRTQPSSEALLRRVLEGKPPYRINALTDALHLCALRMLVPFFAHDLARLAGPVVLRLGREGEGYEGVGQGRVGVEGKPVLADREGPFGGPLGDGLRARVTGATTSALVVLLLPADLETVHAERMLDDVAATVSAHCGGEPVGRWIVG